ncbi:MAG TPA: proline/glycine betaine ABC transporter substrate-binding protein ProX [Acidimicrobiaceae bacterium]|nr:proline/glycine betaine ABC transporter substrate-binding protein ProX [Acidimicrobiaceae bacterium]
MNKSMKLLIALLAVFGLVAAACGDDDSSTDAGTDDAAEESSSAADDAADDDHSDDDDHDHSDEDHSDEDHSGDISSIGAGVEVTMGRANWTSAYVQAEIYKQVLEQAGYTVSSPSLLELDPSAGYLAMAEGSMDFWTNSWYPGHLSWHAAELTDGSLVADHVSIVDGLFAGAGVQGFLTTKSVAEEYGITSMQQINDDPEITALFDSDGNGKADIFGCPESWTCDNIISAQITYYGWDNIEQTIAGYDAMFAQATDLANAGEPMAIYTWTPSAYVTTLIPGDNVLWLTMNETDILDDSNPNGDDGGEFYTQRPGFDGFSADFCTQPCQLGWKPADIQVTANNDFLAANPFLEALFPLMTPSVIDISILQVEQANGDGSEAEVESIAAGWIANNQDLVSSWLEEAAAAS